MELVRAGPEVGRMFFSPVDIDSGQLYTASAGRLAASQSVPSTVIHSDEGKLKNRVFHF